MKKRNNSLAGIAICISGLIIPLIFYWVLPESIPVHWSMNATIDGYAPKIYILAMGVFPVGIYSFLGLIRKIDPKKENYSKFSGVYEIMRVCIAFFMLLMIIITIFTAFYPNALKMDLIITLMVGVLITVYGNYMPKIKHNFFCGIRSPWTIESQEVWAKTHRFAGKLWVAGGLSFVCLGFFLTGMPLFSIMLAITAAISIIPYAYSYFIFNKK